jgi:adenosylcobinamide-GDP ribazoletransferase
MDFFAVLRFLTIIPAPPALSDETSKIGRSLQLFPLVGLLIGIILASLSQALKYALPLPVVSILLVVALALITGAHHLDGLIDTCDAMVTDRTREQRLTIMSDTRVGAFGITGLCLLLIAKYAAILETAGPASLIVFPTLSRWALTAVIIIFPSAKQHGSGYSVKRAAKLSGVAIGTVITLVILVFCMGLIEALVIMTLLFAMICFSALLFNRLYGGLTGDGYGALIEIGEVIALLLLILQAPLRQFIQGYNLFQLPFLKG